MVLSQLAARLTECKANTLHFHLSNQDCPFCRLDRAGAPVFNFRGTGSSVVTLTPDVAIAQAWQDIQTLPLPMLPATPLVSAAKGTPLPAGIRRGNPVFIFGWIMLIGSLVLLTQSVVAAALGRALPVGIEPTLYGLEDDYLSGCEDDSV